MHFHQKYHIHFAAILSILLIITSCSDDSPTSSEPEDVPEIPEATPAEIDNSIFADNNPSGDEFSAFNEAGTFVGTADAQLAASTSLSTVYLSFTETEQAEFNDGIWEWSFNFSEGSESLIIRTTAEELSDGTEWNLYLSGNMEGETVDEFRYMSGFTANDQSSGNWQYFTPDYPNQPIVEYQWSASSESEATFSSIFVDPEQEQESRIDYERNGDENTLEYSGFDTDVDVLIFWNSSDGTGFIQRTGEDQQCWDESFAEVACS